MAVTNKKYFSISEVSALTGIPQHKLRYLKKSKIEIEIFQIKGRRYYTLADIELIKQKMIVGVKESEVSSISNDIKIDEKKVNTDIEPEIIKLNLNNDLQQFSLFSSKNDNSLTDNNYNSEIIAKIDSLISKFSLLGEEITLLEKKNS